MSDDDLVQEVAWAIMLADALTMTTDTRGQQVHYYGAMARAVVAVLRGSSVGAIR